jgi:hypothetical protein
VGLRDGLSGFNQKETECNTKIKAHAVRLNRSKVLRQG